MHSADHGYVNDLAAGQIQDKSKSRHSTVQRSAILRSQLCSKYGWSQPHKVSGEASCVASST